jgi:hypothetical protein
LHVTTVHIGVCAFLLDNEDVVAQPQDRIKRDGVQVGEVGDVKFDHWCHVTAAEPAQVVQVGTQLLPGDRRLAARRPIQIPVWPEGAGAHGAVRRLRAGVAIVKK